MATITVKQYIRELKKLKGKPEHRLTLVNAMPYAVYVHNRKGFWVFHTGHLMRTSLDMFRKAIRHKVPMIHKNRVKTLQAIAITEINYLRSVTSEIRPPKPKSKRARRAHPGHWADRSGNMKGAFWYELDGKAKRQKSATRNA